MPQVDLETLVSACAGGSTDRKVACETLADSHNHNHNHDDDDDDHHPMDETEQPEANPDSPPESFWLSRDEEYDWWDRNAVYERKESTKGNSNNTSSMNLNIGNSNSNSQRFSMNLKSKAAIIGLPKTQKTSYVVDAKNRRNHKACNVRFFPKRSVSVGGKSESSVIEPSSPKVSCMGRVRSKRDRNRRLRTRQRSTSESAAAAREKPARGGRRTKPGFFESLRAIFRSSRRGKSAQKSDPPPADSRTKRSAKARGNKESVNDSSFAESVPRTSVSESEPPGLGSMMRFASGRRSESWGVAESEIHVPQ